MWADKEMCNYVLYSLNQKLKNITNANLIIGKRTFKTRGNLDYVQFKTLQCVVKEGIKLRTSFS